MKSFQLIPAILLVFVVYTTRLDISLKKMFSENTGIEYNDSENAENDKEEKGEEDDGKEDDSKEYSYLHNKLTISYFQAKLNVVAANSELVHPAILVESPPPKS